MEQQKQLHLIMEWDLQWFAKDGPGGEKTEPATAKKLREAREDGKVVKSKELTAAFDLIILFLVLKIFVSFVGNRLMNSFVDIYGRIPDFVRENAVDVTDSDRLCSLFCIWICCDGADQCDPGWVESDRETVAAQIR